MTNEHQRRLAIRAMRGKMRSPGLPSTAWREDRVRFWEAIGRGLCSEDAAAEAGMASAVGARWFREAGGMAPLTFAPVSSRYLSFAEREEIAILHAQQLDVGEIASRVGCAPSTISRELRRNASNPQQRVGVSGRRQRSGTPSGRAGRPKLAKLADGRPGRRRRVTLPGRRT